MIAYLCVVKFICSAAEIDFGMPLPTFERKSRSAAVDGNYTFNYRYIYIPIYTYMYIYLHL